MRTADAPPPGFYAPDPYGAGWLWLGLALVALVVLWFVLVWWLTRRGRPAASGAVAPDRVARLRADYLHQIDLVLAAAREGRTTQRRAHQQLSVLVRQFVLEVSGILAPTMTLTELVGSGHRLEPVSGVVEQLYPGEFAPDATSTVEGAGAVAREVVARWT